MKSSSEDLRGKYIGTFVNQMSHDSLFRCRRGCCFDSMKQIKFALLSRRLRHTVCEKGLEFKQCSARHGNLVVCSILCASPSDRTSSAKKGLVRNYRHMQIPIYILHNQDQASEGKNSPQG